MAIQEYYLKHKKIVVLGVIALVGLFSVGMMMRARSNDPRYLTATVKRGEITAVVQATGTINPLTTVPVGSYVSGTVQYVFADFNSRVHAGQVLAQLDPAIYEAQLIQARGNLATAEANVNNLRASLGGQEAVIESNQANVARQKAAADYSRINARRSSTGASSVRSWGRIAPPQGSRSTAPITPRTRPGSPRNRNRIS